jgi:hypothetical protein
VLLSSYDIIIIIIMILHIFIFYSLITPLMAFCYTRAVTVYPDWALPKVQGCSDSLNPHKPVNCRVVSMRERCERMNWNIHGAGGFSSAIAAILASVHVAALLCRLVEVCFIWYETAKEKTEEKREEKKKREAKWEACPRDIDIYTRGATKTGPGRLTIVSEEEHDTGGDVTQRRGNHGDTRGSEQSIMSSEASVTLIDVLLECLVP